MWVTPPATRRHIPEDWDLTNTAVRIQSLGKVVFPTWRRKGEWSSGSTHSHPREVSFTHRLLYCRERSPISVGQEDGSATGLFWTFWGGESTACAVNGIGSPRSVSPEPSHYTNWAIPKFSYECRKNSGVETFIEYTTEDREVDGRFCKACVRNITAECEMWGSSWYRCSWIWRRVDG
jgi:predicted nucleic acid-binding Zn ribbon protein